MTTLLRFYWGLKFYFKSKTLRNVRSPLIAKFLEHIGDVEKNYYDFIPIEQIRTSYNYDNKKLEINDLGAGTSTKTQSPSSHQKSRSVAEISKHSSSYRSKARLLYNIVDWHKPAHILEFGTNLGIGTSYLQTGNKKASVTTLEGDKMLHSLSQATFKYLGFNGIEALHISFEDFLQQYPTDIYDLVFIDGNHSYDFTTEIFDRLAGELMPLKVLIFDDIYWSQGMKKAWTYIKESLDKKGLNGYTIDLFILGIVIIDTRQEMMEHIKYIPKKYKPFTLGLFG